MRDEEIGHAAKRLVGITPRALGSQHDQVGGLLGRSSRQLVARVGPAEDKCSDWSAVQRQPRAQPAHVAGGSPVVVFRDVPS
jgi:hypothetical protein